MSKASHILITVCALAVSGCSPAPASPEAAEIPTALVSRAEPASGAASTVIGTVRSGRMDVISAEAGGRVLALYADVGDRVAAGQVLARLDVSAQALRVEVAEAERARAAAMAAERSRHAERLGRLLADGTASPAERDAAAAEAEAARTVLRQAEAQVKLARRDRSLAVLRAPVSGVIAVRMAQLSAVLTPGAPAFEIESGTERLIGAALPATTAQRLVPGQTIPFRAGETTGTARLIGISTRENGTGGHEASFAITAGNAAPGAPVELALPGEGRDATARVPQAALLERRDGSRMVLVVDPRGQVRGVPVLLLGLAGAGALVAGRISPGEVIVAAGGEFLTPGQRVRPVFAVR
ncbi:efflux RND transporter periplasmic adaptor subunit [Novosphingobium piscinae]|uniref:Efflux RND transporter periplasmic adaptor subunit n=1 Tax=Novosphingobium piscinae TaxID=1507448 RepID=A0A7X1KNM2_9SPHN|nr:efflux RND transporter periplasmic adaptor subunit [Novosphingobium piscinae]MBC2667844.1 efflux RND transporter periplasmic adaptor subunit [Novosphingobium piscinae]